MNNHGKASIVLLVAIIIIIAAVILSGAKSQRPGMRDVYIKLLSSVPLGANAMNVTYSSIGIHYSIGNYTSWYYYNITQTYTIQGNDTYPAAQFSVPVNAGISGVELTILSSNISAGGSTYNTTFPAKRIYDTVSLDSGNTSATILVKIDPELAPSLSVTSASFEANPYTYAVVGNGTSTPATIQYNITILNTSLVQNNQTSITLSVHDNSNYKTILSSVVLSGNIIIMGNASSASALESMASSLLNTSSLKSILPSGTTLNISQSVSGVISNNSGLLSSISGYIPSSVRNTISSFNLSKISLSFNGVISKSSQYLSQLNISSYKSILEQVLNSDAGFNKSYLSNKNVQELEGMVNNLGGLKNSSIYNGIVSGAIGNEYLQYTAKASSLLDAEAKIGTVSFAIYNNGTLIPLSQAGLLNETGYGLELSPGQSVLIRFNGIIPAGPEGTYITLPSGNIYKVFILGNSTVASTNVIAT